MSFHPLAAKAIEVLFTTFGHSAQLIFREGSSVETLVMHRFPDKVLDIMDNSVHTETNLFEIRCRDVDSTKTLYQIIREGQSYRVQGEPTKDQHGLILRVEAFKE